MQDINVTFVQTEIHWEDIDANLQMFTEKIGKIEDDSDLIVLPEMFNTAFTNNTGPLFEEMNGTTMQWMEGSAKEKNCVIIGSMIIKEEDKYYNRLIWMRPDGTYEVYDKRHLFRMLEEDKYFTEGKQRLVVDLNGWRICPMVCYDLRFPVWNRTQDDYDCFIVTANWPEVRRYAWSQLLIARAIENQCYVIGLNRVGVDGNGIEFSGDSAVVDSKGTVISALPPHAERSETVTLSWQDMEEYREKFPAHLDADKFDIRA